MAALTRWAASQRAAVANHLRPQPRLARIRRQRRAGTGLHARDRRRVSAPNERPRIGGRTSSAPRMRFAVTVGENFFMEIAKLRALRMLWSRAVAAAGGNENAQRLPCTSAPRNGTRRSAIPTTICCERRWKRSPACWAAATACKSGAFDEVIRQPDDFSQRMARNTQLVLQKECELDHVHRSGGRFVVCGEPDRANWPHAPGRCFRKLKSCGGMEAALRGRFSAESRRRHGGGKNQGRRVAGAIPSSASINTPMPGKSRWSRRQLDGKAFHKRRVAANRLAPNVAGRRRERNRAGKAGRKSSA